VELVENLLVAVACVVMTKLSIQLGTRRLGNIEATSTETVAVVDGVEMVKAAVVRSVVAHLVNGGVVVVRRVTDVTMDQRINVVVVVDVVAAPAVGGSAVVVVIETALPTVLNLPKWRPRYCKMLSYPDAVAVVV
jgi:hypothetical protein